MRCDCYHQAECMLRWPRTRSGRSSSTRCINANSSFTTIDRRRPPQQPNQASAQYHQTLASPYPTTNSALPHPTPPPLRRSFRWGAGASLCTIFGPGRKIRSAELNKSHVLSAPLATHCSLLATHHSPLTTHHSLLATHHSLLTTHRSPLTTRYFRSLATQPP